jgi:hypothetical protein
MRLTGEQAKELHDAILSGFGGSDLDALVRFDLNERLDSVVGNGPLGSVVFSLIEWAERNGRIEDLIQAVQRARPHNTTIQDVARSLSARSSEPTPRPGTARLDGAYRARLRAALVEQFPTPSALAMLVDDSLSVNLSAIARGSNLTETVFELIQWASIDPQGQLRPLLAEAVRQRPHSAELKALQTELFGDSAG